MFGWGWDGNAALPPDASTVTVTVEPAEGGSLVTLVHEGLDAEQAKAHAEGWNHYFERLERLAATGDAGPDEWACAPENLDPDRRGRGRARRAAADPARPDRRGPPQADPVRRTSPATSSPSTSSTSLDRLGAMAGATVTDPRAGSLENRVSVMTGQAIDAWRTVDLDGTVPGPGGAQMPASFAAAILPLELTLHGWDLAQASGQHLHISDELVDYLRGARRGRRSRWPRIAPSPTRSLPAEDATAMDRLAAFAGRTPIAA